MRRLFPSPDELRAGVRVGLPVLVFLYVTAGGVL